MTTNTFHSLLTCLFLYRYSILCCFHKFLSQTKSSETTSAPQPFYSPFSRTIRVSRSQKKASSGIHRAREDNKRQTHRQSGWAPLHPEQSAIHFYQSPHFYARCPSCCNPPSLSWLGTGIKYADLHTQWLGSCMLIILI